MHLQIIILLCIPTTAAMLVDDIEEQGPYNVMKVVMESRSIISSLREQNMKSSI